MAISLKHNFTSPVVDLNDPDQVGPDEWNAEHVLTLGTDKLLGRDTAGTGAVEEIGLGAGLAFSGSGTVVVTIGTDVQAYSARLGEIAALSVTDGNIIVGNGSAWVAESGATARASLGLTIGTHVQAWDAQLDTWATVAPSANGQSLVSAADYAAMRALLDLEAGTDFLSPAAIALAYQPLDGDLSAIAALTTTVAGLTSLTFADPGVDRILAWDDSAGAVAPIALADITAEGAPASGDYVLAYTAEGALVKINWDDLPGAGSGDMLAANNLSDVANAATAFGNIKQAATTSATGVSELATDAEAQAKSDTARVITPSNLAALGASDSFAGLIELASDAEAQAQSSTSRALTPANLAALASTTSMQGLVEKATDAEVRSAASGKGITADLIESASALVALTDAATVAVDWDAGINFSLTVTANRAIGNPTNGQPGTFRTILVQGDSTTDRTITFGANFLGEVPTITDCDSDRWYLLTIFCVTTSHFVVSSKKAKGT